MSNQPPQTFSPSNGSSYRRGSLDSERHLHETQLPSASFRDSTGAWTPGLDPIADGHGQWAPEDGPSAWDPQLDPSRGRE